jgi:ATP adenylyltransferase
MITSALVKAKYAACLQSGFLLFYPSLLALRRLADSEIFFQIRLCPDLLNKRNETKAVVSDGTNNETSPKPPAFNPFLPFDKNLWVADLKTPSHVLIFNKYCLIPEHLLVITRDFVPQSTPFCKEDFDAVLEVLDALGEARPFAFFNSGLDAGASQAHRHFQVVCMDGKGAVIEAAMKSETSAKPFTLSCFRGIRHACIKLEGSNISPLEAFHRLQSACSLNSPSSFNLIWSREWMLLVPRRKEFTDDHVNSLNALAFAGYVLVMDEAHLENLNVLSALQEVTFPQ